jgi:branched-subunit amino acid aminotransferase/4-amino-4-deoxychorismate lyase
MLVWLNGKFFDRDAATVSIFDAGFQHGVGLFETMLARNGQAFRVEQHMQRLANSARALLLSERLRVEPLADAVNLTLQRNNMSEARVRLTITGGNLNMLQSQGKPVVDPTIAIVAQPPTRYPEHFFERGVIVTIAPGRLSPLDPMAGHKTLHYWPRISALQAAAAQRAGEALWLARSDTVVSACVSNIFIIKDGSLFTPVARGEHAEPDALAPPALPGITRAAVLEIAESLDMPATARTLTIHDVLNADEVFLTNSSWGVLPVVGVEREKISEGAVGPITRQLREAWLTLVDAETAAAGM